MARRVAVDLRDLNTRPDRFVALSAALPIPSNPALLAAIVAALLDRLDVECPGKALQFRANVQNLSALDLYWKIGIRPILPQAVVDSTRSEFYQIAKALLQDLATTKVRRGHFPATLKFQRNHYACALTAFKFPAQARNVITQRDWLQKNLDKLACVRIFKCTCNYPENLNADILALKKPLSTASMILFLLSSLHRTSPHTIKKLLKFKSS